jgi:hypothetical protein
VGVVGNCIGFCGKRGAGAGERIAGRGVGGVGAGVATAGDAAAGAEIINDIFVWGFHYFNFTEKIQKQSMTASLILNLVLFRKKRTKKQKKMYGPWTARVKLAVKKVVDNQQKLDIHWVNFYCFLWKKTSLGQKDVSMKS